MNWIPCLGNHYISAALFVPDSSNRAVMLCTSSFIDVMFAHNGWEQMTQKGTCTEPLNGGQQAAKIWHCCIYSNWPTRWQHWTGGRCQVCKLWLALFFAGFYAIRWGIKITVVFVVFYSLLGLSEHYTDVGHISVSNRRRLLGQAWSIPVIKHLLRPLRAYYGY